MGKEIFAAALMAVLIIAAVLNILYIDNLVESITQQIDISQEHAVNGDYEKAWEELSNGLALWEEKQNYTGVILRSTALDDVENSFCQLLNDLDAADGVHAGSYEKLRLSMKSISKTEHVSLATIF